MKGLCLAIKPQLYETPSLYYNLHSTPLQWTPWYHLFKMAHFFSSVCQGNYEFRSENIMAPGKARHYEWTSKLNWFGPMRDWLMNHFLMFGCHYQFYNASELSSRSIRHPSPCLVSCPQRLFCHFTHAAIAVFGSAKETSSLGQTQNYLFILCSVKFSANIMLT